ncbi:DUF4126 domain-containing protein [Desertivibrio insolitus]|uniref:DUF4126 domain-containing protein n=1 Tax=Herbiconiux sp. SYSU D00978 TaxID=2812562 RepID=UPI001A97AB09|nr:DUF4126 domain-containing protein [Herbiconiux sp. SYSU D00978]
MVEFLTGAGLAAAAGLNAYVPMLLLGLLDRFTGLVALPDAWAWLSNEWVLVILGVLLVFEVVADKVPAVDSVNDLLQTVVRPASGGIVFGSGTAAQTTTVSDPAEFFSSNAWVPVVTGVVLALVVHLVKAAARPALNAMTGGLAAPAVSALEDVGSVALAASAVLLPLLVVVLLAGLVVLVVFVVRERRRARRRNAGPSRGTA